MMRLFLIIYILSAFQAFSQEVWTVRQSGITDQITSIAFANGQFMAVHGDGWNAGSLLASTDGIKWQRPDWVRGMPIEKVWGSGAGFLITSNSSLLFSTGAGQPTKIPMGSYTVQNFGNTAERNGVWIISGGYDRSAGEVPLLRYSAGVLRKAEQVPFSSSPDWLLATPEGFILQESGALYASPDGDVWTLKKRGIFVERPVIRENVLYASGRRSLDWGETWQTVGEGGRRYEAILFAANTFISPLGGQVATSGDYSVWTTRETGTTDDLTTAAYGNGAFVLAGYGGRIVTSPAVAAPPVKTPVEASITASVTVKWPSVSGRTYTIESSADLQRWEQEASSLPGNGVEMTRAFDVQAGRKYFRVMEE